MGAANAAKRLSRRRFDVIGAVRGGAIVTTAKVDFSSVRWGSVEWTNLVTLYLRACESRSPHPILGDHAAAAAVDRIDYDFQRIHRTSLPASNQYLVTLRPNSSTTGVLISFDGIQTPSFYTLAAASTAAPFGSAYRRPRCGSTSISPVSSSCAVGYTTIPSSTG
jgi:hypothetical protein